MKDITRVSLPANHLANILTNKTKRQKNTQLNTTQ